MRLVLALALATAVAGCVDTGIDFIQHAAEKPPYTGIRLTQVAYDTPGEEAFEEFIDLFNQNDVAVSLAGWSLTDESATWVFPDNAVIQPNAFLTVARDHEGFAVLHGRSADVDGLSLFLDNGGDVISLLDPTGNTADMVAWQWFVPGWALYSPAGDSLARLHPDGDWGLAGDWIVRSPAAPDGGV